MTGTMYMREMGSSELDAVSGGWSILAGIVEGSTTSRPAETATFKVLKSNNDTGNNLVQALKA